MKIICTKPISKPLSALWPKAHQAQGQRLDRACFVKTCTQRPRIWTKMMAITILIPLFLVIPIACKKTANPETPPLIPAVPANTLTPCLNALNTPCTSTHTNTPTPTGTFTEVFTISYTPTITKTLTNTSTVTGIYANTITYTNTVMPTSTFTPSPSFTYTTSLENTVTSTHPSIQTNTSTPYSWPSNTCTNTIIFTATATFTPTQTYTNYLYGTAAYSSGTVDENHPIILRLFDNSSFTGVPVATSTVYLNNGSYFLPVDSAGTDYGLAMEYKAVGAGCLECWYEDGDPYWFFNTGDTTPGNPINISGATHLIVAFDDSYIWGNITQTPTATHIPSLTPTSGSPTPGHLMWSYPAGYFGVSCPAMGDDGAVYVNAGNTCLLALNQNGTKKWSYETGGNEGNCSPAIGIDGTIYVWSGDQNLYAINQNGTMKWSYPISGVVYSSPAIGSNGSIYIGSTNLISTENYLYSLSSGGSLNWTFTASDWIVGSPAIGVDGTIYVGCYDSIFYAFNPNGSVKWTYTTGNEIISSPAIGNNGNIYFGCTDNKLYSINSSGAENWTYSTGGRIASSPVIDTDGTIYFASADTNLYALYSNGTLKWSFPLVGDSISAPAIGNDGTIYVGSGDHNVYAINHNGTLKWRYTTGGSVWSSAAIGNDGTVYIGSEDGNLYALEGSGQLANSPWPKFHLNSKNTGSLQTFIPSTSTATYSITPTESTPGTFTETPTYYLDTNTPTFTITSSFTRTPFPTCAPTNTPDISGGTGVLMHPDWSPVHTGNGIKKVIILIHGWTNKDLVDAPTDAFLPTWSPLIHNLSLALNGTDITLLEYHWEVDASTGECSNWSVIDPVVALGCISYASSAASNGFMNGQRLAGILTKYIPDLREVTFIAHSAGAWVAYRAADKLLQYNSFVVVNVVLIDPFIPGDCTVVSPTLNTALMSSLASNANADRIYRLENYYSYDVGIKGTDTDRDGVLGSSNCVSFTSRQFSWRSQDINFGQLNYTVPSTSLNYYDDHSGPITFYADTVADAISGGESSGGLFIPPWSRPTTELGIYESLYYQGVTLLPIITEQLAASNTTPNIGESVTFSIVYSNGYSAPTFSWYKDCHVLPNTGSSLKVDSVTAYDSGVYVLGMHNDKGWRFSDPVKLVVNTP